MSKSTSPRRKGKSAASRKAASAAAAVTGDGQQTAPPADIPVATAAESSGGAGILLRNMREQAGIELEVLASALKVAPYKLQALENDRPDQLPGLVFARGLAANVCRYLGQDAQPVLARMPTDTPPVSVSHEALLDSPVSGGHKVALPLKLPKGLPVWAIALMVCLVIAALALALWPHFYKTERVKAVTQPSASATVVPQTLTSAAVAPQALASAAAPTTPPEAAPSNVSDGLLLRTGTNGNVWVQVRHRTGKVLFERTLPPNSEHHLIVSNYPVRVTVGRVENIQVIDRGTPFDTSAVATTGVARFQIQ